MQFFVGRGRHVTIIIAHPHFPKDHDDPGKIYLKSQVEQNIQVVFLVFKMSRRKNKKST